MATPLAGANHASKEVTDMSATPRIPVPHNLDAPLPDDAAAAGREEAPRRADRDGHRLRLPVRPGRRGGRRRPRAGRRLGRDDRARLPLDGAGLDRRDADAGRRRRAAGCSTPLLVGDLPFGSYEGSDEQAIATAQRFIKEAGCDAVKLERGGDQRRSARARSSTPASR